MNSSSIQSAACVAILMYIGLVVQGCGAPGEAVTLSDGVNSGDPCSVCNDPHSQGPEAGDLNNGDFVVFCTTQCKKHPEQDAEDAVAEGNKEVHETNMSPPTCDVCKRPDAQGYYAGTLNDDDFQVFCSKCPAEELGGRLAALYQSAALAVQAKQEENLYVTMAGIHDLKIGLFSFCASGLFFITVSFALKRRAYKAEPLLYAQC